MPGKFDPYYRWLGIPPKEQPPNHYRLLGLDLFEADPALIDSFALRHTSFLREITDGPHLPDAQRLLNELAAARRCLLDPQRKAAYDGELRTRLAAAGTVQSDPAAAVTPPVSVPAPVSHPGPEHQPALCDLSSIAVVAETDHVASRPAAPSRPKPRRPLAWLVMGSIGIAGVLVAVVIAAVYVWRAEPSRSGPTTADAGRGAAKPPLPSSSPPSSPTPSSPLLSPQSGPGDPPSPADLPGEPSGGLPASSAPDASPLELKPPPDLIPDGQPPRLPGLVLWLDASQLEPAGARIARWSDGSAGGYVAQQKQPDRQPELLPQGLNGKPVARFCGRPWLEIPGTSQALNLGSGYTIVYVARGLGGTLLCKGVGGKAGQFSLLSDSCFLTNGEINSQTAGRLPATGDDPTQFRVRTIAADATALTWYIDGSANGSFSGERYDVQNKSMVRIGGPASRSAGEDAGQWFVGDLAELLIYGRALPQDEREGVEAYLRQKWLSGGKPPAPLDLVAVPAESPPAESPPAESPSAESPPAQAAAGAAMPEAPPEAAGAVAPEGVELAPTGQIQREVLRNFRGVDPDAANQLIADRPTPDLTETLDRLEAPSDFDDNYCQRIRGFLQPPLTGDYTFTVRANEGGLLLVSPDENPENKQPVTGKDKIRLTAGRAYYFEAIHWEKGGKDSFSVGWKLPGGKEENPIPGTRLSLRDRPIPPHETGFVTLKPVRAEASAGSQLKILEDGSVLSDGATKENEVYRLVLQTPMPAMTALQLQTVPHESLPGGGPGIGLGGSFRLGEVQVAVGSADTDAAPRTVKFREVLTGEDDSGLARLIDGNPATVWNCRRGGQAISLTLLPAEPIDTSGAAVLNVTLHNRDNLGCFRFLATSMSDPRQLVAVGGSHPPAARSDLFTLFVNLGGGPWQDPAGNSWVASKDFDGATFGHEAGQAIKADPVEHPMYSTAVRKLTGFRAVVPNGEYRVELHFHEHWSRSPADRSFAVTVEQRPVLRPPLFFQGPGMGQPYVHLIDKVTVKDGRLDVDFSPTLPGSLTILNGIAIRQLR